MLICSPLVGQCSCWYKNISESVSKSKPDGFKLWWRFHCIPCLEEGQCTAALGSVLCSVCVSSPAWYLAVLGEELDLSHGPNHVVHEAVLEDCRGLVRDGSGSRGQQAPECDSSVLGSKEFFI